MKSGYFWYLNAQFITRKAVNNDILQRTETILDDYLNTQTSIHQGLPTVQYLSDQLKISPGYLSDLLRSLIGQNAQQYIRGKVIEKAKERLTNTDLTVAEIAYELGFEHPQSFSKMFRLRTGLSPLEFRTSFD